MSITKKDEEKKEGMWKAVVTAIEAARDIAIKNLPDRPLLSFAVIGLIFITITAIILSTSTELSEGILYRIIISFLGFIIIMSILSAIIKRLLPPTKPDDDKIKTVDPKNYRIWEGFEGNYYAFNAPFELERDISDYKLRQARKIHNKRYESENFQASYLYFTGKSKTANTKFKRWIKNFEKFFNPIKDAHLGDNLKLYIIKDEEIPDYTFFVGKKDGKECTILYPFRQTSGTPIKAFEIYDTGFAETLSTVFMGAREKAKAQDGEIKTKEELSKITEKRSVRQKILGKNKKRGLNG